MMSKIVLLLVVLVCSALMINAEVIVQDFYGNSVTLPITGGSVHGGYTVANSLIPTSPYVLWITITDAQLSYPNNGTLVNFPGVSQENFYIHPGTVVGGVTLYGNATLVSSYYTTSLSLGGAQQPIPNSAGNILGTQNNPNTAIGSYFYTFTIPQGQFIAVNLTYNVTANPVESDDIFISVTNPIIPGPSSSSSSSSTGVRIVGDPQFIGLRGQSYQVHGVDGAVYNIISEQNTQVNSRFTFLSSGKCPIFNGVPDTNCWSHPGSYLGELSFQQVVDGKIHAVLVSAGDAKNGFVAIQMDGKALKVGETVTFGSFSIQYDTTHRVLVQTENYAFELSNSDLFINQAVRVRSSLNRLTAHGLLGQTHSDKVYPNALRYIEGQVDDYLIADNDIFGDDFVYNKFQL